MKRERGSNSDSAAPGRDRPPAKVGDGNAGGAKRLGWILLFVVALGVAAAVGIKFSKRDSTKVYESRPVGSVTFTKNVAPIIFNHCATCHRPGQSGPFELLSYADVKKHARQIAEVTRSRYMPPWPPEPGYGHFVGERGLNVDQIGLLAQWVAEGQIEGAASDLPPLPHFPDGWQLGPPDLVIQLPQAYQLPASGRDVYRNFVIPIPSTTRRYVNAMELHPGNKSAHHAFMLFDRTRQSRRLDEQDAEPGFGGMRYPASAEGPSGQFASWQPGKVPASGSSDSIWNLEAGTDLVLQMHLQPTGKSESIQPSLALYFTNTPPSRALQKISLSSYAIDIPAGATNYLVTDSYVLPVDGEVLSILPHAHYLGKEIQGLATLPDGTQQWLLRIKDWNFNWQGDYRFVQPVALPKGTKLSMQWAFDNSTNNIRNPHHPPNRVVYGIETTNEMAELWFQVRLQNASDLAAIQRDLVPKVLREIIEFNTLGLKRNPNDAKSHARLGAALMETGQTQEAMEHLRTAIALEPDFDEPHYDLGLLFREAEQLPAAKKEFETVLRLNPESYKAHGNLGFILVDEGDLDRAEFHFRSALKINPDDSLARESLSKILKSRKR